MIEDSLIRVGMQSRGSFRWARTFQKVVEHKLPARLWAEIEIERAREAEAAKAAVYVSSLPLYLGPFLSY